MRLIAHPFFYSFSTGLTTSKRLAEIIFKRTRNPALFLRLKRSMRFLYMPSHEGFQVNAKLHEQTGWGAIVDTELLVDSRTEDGRKLLAELARAGFHVAVGFWVKTSEEGSWSLYIASDSFDPARVGDAYQTVYACLSRIPESSMEL